MKCVIPAPLSSIDFSRPRKRSLPLPPPQNSITHSKHYCSSNPMVGKHPLSKETLNALCEVNKEAAIFTSLTCYEVKDASDARTGKKNAVLKVKQSVNPVNRCSV